jgi:hypothetical protein
MGEASGKTQKEQLWADVFDSERAFVTARDTLRHRLERS